MTEQMLNGGDDSRRTVLGSMPTIIRLRFLLRAHAWGELRSHSAMRTIHFALLMVILVAVSLAAGCDTSDSPTAIVNEEEFYMTIVPADQIIDQAIQLEEISADVTPLAEDPLDTFEFVEISDDEAATIVRYVPERFTLYQARVYEWPEGDWIYFRYGRLNLIEHPFGSERKLPGEFTETLTINGERAYLVRGWPYSVPGDGDEDRRWFWDESGRLALYFKSGDRTFEIDVLGGETMTRDEIIRMAESVN